MPLAPSAYRTVLANGAFRRLVLPIGISDLGDGMSAVVVPMLAIQVAGPGDAAVVVGAAIAAYSLPGILGVLVLGRWLRRLPAARVLAADSLIRALLLGAVALTWATGLLTPHLLIGLLAVSSVLHAWGSAGKFTLVADLLPAESRLAGNALVTSVQSASIIVGPAIAGFLVTTVDPAWLVGADALSFAALALAAVRHRGTSRDSVHQSPPGLRMLTKYPTLVGLLVLTWFFYILYGPVNVALPLHVTQGTIERADLLGLYWTAFGIGAVVGSLGAGALRSIAPWPALLTIVALWGILLLPFGFHVPTAVEIACFSLGGLVWGPYPAISLTLMQSSSPPESLTTVLAVRTAILLTASPLGSALGGPLTQAIEPSTVLAVSGAATIIVAVVAMPVVGRGGRLRRRTTHP